MRSLVGTLTGRAPVSYMPRRSSFALPTMSRSDPVSQMSAMGSVGTLFSIVHRLSNATSQVEWQLWRKAASGKKEDRVQVTAHAALDTWNTANPFMPRQEYVETFQQHLDLTGEAWWLIARDPRSPIPLELWPVRPDRMAPVPDPDEFIAGYVYTSPDGESVPLDRRDVIQLRMPNPLDVYRGMGPVQAVLADLDASRYSAEWNRNFFANSAEPGGLIKVERRLSRPEWDELRERWAEQHRGVANAHRVAILEGGADWVDRKFTQRDMQFAELRRISRDVIREAFGMPKFAVGDVDDVNRATAEASSAWFAEQLVVPRLQRIKAALNSEFLPLFGPTATGLEFDYEDPVPANREADNAELTARSNAASTLVTTGYAPDEVLQAVGLPAMTFVGAPAGTSPPPAGPPPLGPSTPSRRAAPPSEHAHAGGLDPIGCDACLHVWVNGAGDNDGDGAAREDWEDRVDALLEDWTTTVSTAQFDELVQQVEAIVAAGTPADLSTLATTPDAGAELLTDAMYAQAIAAALRIVADAADHGVTIAAAVPVEPPTDRVVNAVLPEFRVIAGLAADLSAAARVTATNLANRLAASAAAEAMRVWAPGSTAREVAGKVRGYLEGLTTAALGVELSAAIWTAENEGRFATYEEADADGAGPSRYVANEIRDRNTCAPCKRIDGREFTTRAAAETEYPFGGYRSCDGGGRCRGTVDPIWGDS